MFEKVSWFIRDYNGTKYLALFGPEKYDAIFNRIKHCTNLKSSIFCVVSYNYGNIKIDSDND